MEKIVIVAPVRTPIGSFGGGLKDVPADYLLAICFSEVIKRAGINPNIIDEVVAGTIFHSSEAPNLARVAALRAGVPVRVPALSVQRNCASGIQSITYAAQAIKA